MPSKTAARSGSRSSRSKSSARAGTHATQRKPAPRRNPSPISSAGATVGRGVRAGWLMLAKGAGSTARSVGRARDLEPGHRRDGIALALLGIAVVIAASSWFDAARPVGAWIDTVPAGAHRLLGRVVAARAGRDRRGAHAHRARPRDSATADPRRGHDRAARSRPVASVGGFPGGVRRATTRCRLRRFRDRWSALRRADGVDRGAPAVHRRTVRPASRHRHDDPRGARHPSDHVLRARVAR